MQRRFIGIDLHKESFTVAIKNQSGEIKIHTFDFANKSIEKFKELLSPDDYVAIEVSTSTFYMYDIINPLVKKCVIVHPKKFRIICESTSKTDKKDAKLLAKYLSYEDLLPEVYVPDHNIRKLRTLFSMYNLNNKQITQIKNRIHSILLQNGIPLSKNIIRCKKYRNAIFNLEIDNLYIDLIKHLFKKMDLLLEEKEYLTYKILSLGEKYKKDINILTSLSGISVLIALALISDIADIKRFKNPNKLASYLGVVPKVDNTGNTIHNGRIHKDSRKNTRTLLTQVVKHLYNNSPELKDFYIRKRKAKGAGKARIALIRKIIFFIFWMISKNKYSYYRV